ncbi:MAG TPA: sigma-70 family RNA polymerase sigma factor [Tepidisphaeraceae bacterium]|jgi:RNA polymerase sigma factor (sigma-70 family)
MESMTADVPQDAELVRQFASEHSQAAFAELVERHAGWVFAAAYRQLRDRHLAEDATQAVFLLLARKAHAMNENHKISGWLFNATQYTVKSIRRSNSRRQKYERDVAKAEMMKNEQAAELSEYLDAAVAKLPAKDRLIVLRRFYQGMEFVQIATSMNMTESAARRRLNRAVGRLRLGVSADAMSAAAMAGREMMPGHLCQQICRMGTSKAIGTGASVIHLATFTKIAAIGLASAAAIAVPISLRNNRREAVTTPAAAMPIVSMPATSAPMTQYEKRCIPEAGQIIVWIKQPFPSGRLQYYRDHQSPQQVKDAPMGPTSMLLRWEQGKLRWKLMDFGNSMDVSSLMRALLGIYPQLIEGNRDLIDSINLTLPGDIAVREGATREQICLGLNELVFEQLTIPVSLKLRMVQRKVIVLSGQWHDTPVNAKYKKMGTFRFMDEI